MAIIKPFPTLLPATGRASEICELPYDVMSTAEARQMAEGRPSSFLHVSRPEIDLPEGTDPTDPRVYAKARENLDRLIAEGALRADDRAHYYLYRQIMGEHSQLGLVAVASCAEYSDNTIRKHEFTRPAKEDDRVAHLEALDAQTGPVFLAYPADAGLDELFDRILEIRDSGIAVLMVEQNAAQALAIADRGYVLVTGENRFSDSGKALLEDPEVRRSFLGG